VGERLREVADEPLAHRVVLLGQETDVVAHVEHPLEERSRLLVPTLQREAVREPTTARQERALTTGHAVDVGLGVVAADESVDRQPFLDRGDRAGDPRVGRRQEPDQGHHQDACVKRLGPVRLRERAEVVVEALVADLRVDLLAQRPPPVDRPIEPEELDEEPPERYLAGVEATLAAIGRGDVYQANLSRRWRARLKPGVDATDIYRRLRRANPAPFAGVAHLPGFSVLSSSPERLLRVENGSASTRPIAGTRPRGQTQTSDESLRSELRLNEKEQAEHVMLVDLERNDLGRVCRAGTVRVDEYMTIESYTHVHHIVSNVRGELRDDVTPGQAIAAVFPGGTITGCPKIRCIQLLAELEHEPREAYTGSMGYLRLDGDLDLNILIRTITVAGDRLEFRTGAGIVADSQPEAELAETRAKARGLLRALGAPG